MILENGYSYFTDYWAIGVCLYQSFCGNLPFGDSETDNIKIYRAIMVEAITFPDFVKDNSFKDLVNRLLDRDLQKRLIKFENIKKHEFFADIDWRDLSLFKIDPELKPKNRFTDEFLKLQKISDFSASIKDKLADEDYQVYVETEENRKIKKYNDEF